MSRKLNVVLSLVVILGIAAGPVSADQPTFRPGAPGVGDPYFPLDGNGGYDVKHYLLDVRYDPSTDLLQGRATLRARATQHLSRFNLDLDGALAVTSAKVDRRSAGVARDGDELTLTPARGIRKGEQFVVAHRVRRHPNRRCPMAPASSIPTTVPWSSVSRTWPTHGSRPTIIRSIGPRTRSESPCRAASRRSPTAGWKAQRTRAGWTTWEVGRPRTDGDLPRGDGHRRAGDHQLSGRWNQVLGRHRSGSPCHGWPPPTGRSTPTARSPT